jgi:hypothetical protein
MEHAKDLISVKQPKQGYHHHNHVESVALWPGSVKKDVGDAGGFPDGLWQNGQCADSSNPWIVGWRLIVGGWSVRLFFGETFRKGRPQPDGHNAEALICILV